MSRKKVKQLYESLSADDKNLILKIRFLGFLKIYSNKFSINFSFKKSW